jgi:hypothetical protein
MRALRASLAVFGAVLPWGTGAAAVNGQIEINQVTGNLIAGAAPYLISASGSYILTSNLVTSGANAIDVGADDVEIDLNGFTIVGPGSGTGIEESGRSGLTVRNGVIEDFSIGIAAKNDSKLIDLRLSGNNQGVIAGHGGVLVGPGSTVTANTISSNHGFGLTLPTTSGYTNNTLSGNGPGGVGPDVITPPSLTGAFGNNCSGVACP